MRTRKVKTIEDYPELAELIVCTDLDLAKIAVV